MNKDNSSPKQRKSRLRSEVIKVNFCDNNDLSYYGSLDEKLISLLWKDKVFPRLLVFDFQSSINK